MISFKQSGGASDFELGGQMETNRWERVKNLTISLLRARGEQAVFDVFQTHRFTLCDATNGFGDDFHVLLARLSIEDYLLMETQRDEYTQTMRTLAATVSEAAKEFVRFVSFDFNESDIPENTVKPLILVDTGQSVKEALHDMEAALHMGRPLSGVDRAHTALQGHLELICSKANIPFNDRSEIAFLFQLIRNRHPAFQGGTTQDTHVQKALNGLAKVVDALSPVRNHGSIAHPNDGLLEPAEAMLMVNAVKTILTYIDTKIPKS